MQGHDLIYIRDKVTLEAISGIEAPYQLTNRLVQLEKDIHHLDVKFKDIDTHYVPFRNLEVYTLLSDFHDTALTVADALDHVVGVIVARESVLNSIVEKSHQQQNLSTDAASLLYTLASEQVRTSEVDKDLARLLVTFKGLNEQHQHLMSIILTGHNAEFVEEIEHKFTDLVLDIEHQMVVIAFLMMIVVFTTLIVGYLLRAKELKRNNAAFQASMENAKQASEAKSLFLATMSHELRTPMNGVLGLAQLIKEQSSEPEIKSQAQTMIDSGQHLVTLLNDILDFSKVEQGKMTLEHVPFSFESAVQQINGALKPLADNKGLLFEIENQIPNDIEVIGDSSRTRQIMFNLIGNAIKFTETGKVTVSIDYRWSDAQNVVISVKDTGIGIEREKLKAIFSPFEQAELSTTRNYGGTGLGLSIVKQLIELMDGEIDVFSQPNVGTEFTVKLKYAVTHVAPSEDSTPPRVSENTPPINTEKLRVLLAEDNKINALVMGKFFKSEGHEFTHVTDGVKALKALQSQMFDLVVMDNHMPKMSGIEAIEKIRNQLGLNVCVFAFTADVFKEAHDAFIEAGADFVLTKPLQINSLRDAIAQYSSKISGKLLINASEDNEGNVVYLVKAPIDSLSMTEEELSKSSLVVSESFTKAEVDELLNTFVDEAEQKVDELIGAYTNASSKELYIVLHSVKGILFEFGLHEAAILAQEAESIARNKQIPELELLQSLINRLLVNSHQAQRILSKEDHQDMTG